MGRVHLQGIWYPVRNGVNLILRFNTTEVLTFRTVSAVPAGTCESLKDFDFVSVFLTVKICLFSFQYKFNPKQIQLTLV